MFPKTIVSPSCAARCGQLDLTPSPFWVVAWFSWLGASLACVLITAGLPWMSRIGLVLGFGVPGAAWIRRCILLRGRHALRGVEWTEQGEFHLRLKGSRHRLPARPAWGCQRYGHKLWILRFDTAEGGATAVIDPSRLDPEAIRRLGRQLNVFRRRELITS